MDPKLVSSLVGNPLLQGFVVKTLVDFVKGFAKGFDSAHKVDEFRPYLEKSSVIITLVLTAINAALQGNLQNGVNWDSVVSAVVFFLTTFLATKAAPSTQVEKQAKKLAGGVKELL